MLRAFLAIVGLILLIPILGLCWLYFDSSGLPDIDSLVPFAPKVDTQVADACLQTDVPILAVSYEHIGVNLLNAFSAEGTTENYPGFFESLYGVLAENQPRHQPQNHNLSVLVSKNLFCGRPLTSPVNHHLDTLRLTIQLERRFSHQQLFTIYVNRVFLGHGTYGIEAASQQYFHKSPSELSIAEAATIAGLPKEPMRYSPVLYPEKALKRRNQIIDAMLTAHSISEAEAIAAKATALKVN